MYSYRVYTLFDITPTGVIRHPKPIDKNYKEQLFKRNQQRNWETIQQVLGMRAQITVEKLPEIISNGTQFSKKVHKNTLTWCFEFSVENTDVYGPELELLLADCHGAPMIIELNEKAKIPQAMLNCYGDFKNLHIETLAITE